MAGTGMLTLVRRHSLRPMVALALCLAGLLGLALVAAAADLRATLALGGPVYTIAQVYDHGLQMPDPWVNRTVRVRAIFGACDTWLAETGSTGPCMSWQAGLVDPGLAARSRVLSLIPGDPPPLLAFLRRLPLLARLAPVQQIPALGKAAVYWVRLRAIASSSRGPGVFVEVVPIDAAPGALLGYRW